MTGINNKKIQLFKIIYNLKIIFFNSKKQRRKCMNPASAPNEPQNSQAHNSHNLEGIPTSNDTASSSADAQAVDERRALVVRSRDEEQITRRKCMNPASAPNEPQNSQARNSNNFEEIPIANDTASSSANTQAEDERKALAVRSRD